MSDIGVAAGDARLGAEKSCCPNIGSVCTTLLLLSVTTVVIAVIGIVMCNDFLDPARCQTIKVGIIKYVANILEMLGAKLD